MGSSGKARTTYAKLNRESKLRDKRAEKETRKAARRLDAASEALDVGSGPGDLDGAPVDSGANPSDAPVDSGANPSDAPQIEDPTGGRASPDAGN